MSNSTSDVDYFARITAVIGLLVAIVAVALPYFQKRADEEEKLNVWMRTNMGGIVKISDDPSKTSAVQIPWLFTLSNTGKVKLSIIGFDVRQIIGEGHRKFPGLTGSIEDKNGNSLLMPVSLDAAKKRGQVYS